MPNDEKQNKAADIEIEELNYAKEVVVQRVHHPNRFENTFKEVYACDTSNFIVLFIDLSPILTFYTCLHL